MVESFCVVQGRLQVWLKDPDGPVAQLWTREALGGGGWTKEAGPFVGCPEPKAASRWRRDDSMKDRTLYCGERACVSLPKRLRSH